MSTAILTEGRRQAIRDVATVMLSAHILKGEDVDTARALVTYDMLLVTGLLGPDVTDTQRLERSAIRTLINSLGA